MGSLQEGIKECKLKPHNMATYCEVLEQLKLYGKTAVVQPTGTGKSYIALKLMQDYWKYGKLFIGDSLDALRELERKPEWVSHNTTVLTYSSLNKLLYTLGYDTTHEYSDKEIVDVKNTVGWSYDIKLIILDEVHRAGADIWSKGVRLLIRVFPEALVLGLTATPIRFLDKRRDIVSELFNGVSAGNITIRRAVDDGILPKSTYVLSMLSISNDIKVLRSKIKRKKKVISNDENISESIDKNFLIVDSEIVKYERGWDRDTEIVGLLSKYLIGSVDKNYKHIVFAPTIDIADKMVDIVRGWFEGVYSNLGITVNICRYHSGNSDRYLEFDSYRVDKGVGYCDVMIAVNMANSSLHIKNTKSVIMLRYTNSPNMYIQQIGRALSSGGEEPIIFDFVGNLDSINDAMNFIGKVGTDNSLNEANNMFYSIEDNTKEFRNLIDTANKVVTVPWYSSLYTILEYVDEYKIDSVNQLDDIELYRWLVSEQKKFIRGSLTESKEKEFKRLGVLAYMTPRMTTYGKQWFKLVDRISRGEYIDDGVIHTLKFRMYCELLPEELSKYMNDTGLEFEITETWFKDACLWLNASSTETFYTMLNEISQGCMEYKLGIDRFIRNVDLLLRFKEFIKDTMMNSTYPEESRDTMFAYLLNGYMKMHSRDIMRHIDTDTGTLKTYITLYKYAKGVELDSVEQDIIERLIRVDESLISDGIREFMRVLQIRKS